MEYREEVIEAFREFAELAEDPKAPYFTTGFRTYNVLEALGEIERKSEVGLQLYRNWEKLYDAAKKEKDAGKFRLLPGDGE